MTDDFARTILPDHVLVRKPREGDRLVEVTGDLFEFIGTRSEDGRKLSYEWGEPDGGIYTPTITATDDGLVLVPRAEYERLQQVEATARAYVTSWDHDALRAALSEATS